MLSFTWLLSACWKQLDYKVVRAVWPGDRTPHEQTEKSPYTQYVSIPHLYTVLTPRSKCCFFSSFICNDARSFTRVYIFIVCDFFFRFAVCCVFQLGSLLSLVDNLLPLVEHFLIRSNFLFLFITLFLLRHYCPFTAMLNVPNKCDNWNVRPVRVYFRFTAVGPNHIK